MLRKNKERFADLVIVGEEQVSLRVLQKRAKRANRKFWGLGASFALISSMVLPYMSYAAAVADSGTSKVFNSDIVAPGYSMGGVPISAYGIDLNSWGKISRDAAVRSNYGVWSGSRGESANDNLNDASVVTLLDSDESANLSLTDKEKSEGWSLITGKAGYSTTNPNGLQSTQGNQIDKVAPYRTTSDYNFWDAQSPTSNGSASADIIATLYADFIVISIDENNKTASVLFNPDDVTLGDNKSIYAGEGNASQAIPYYVPLSAIFEDFGIRTAEEATITNLLDVIASSPSAATTLYNTAKKNNLLDGTTYAPLNGTGEASEAFNPYPYTMVFSKNTDNGKVVSSMYENSEAYVYFSPSSVYTQYMLLRSEYEAIKNDQANKLQPGQPHDPATVFQLGYYLAEMSILEAYLNEALPQDMTRGYVGATQPRGLTDGTAGDGNPVRLGGNEYSSKGTVVPDIATLQNQTYASIMYDVAMAMPENKISLEWRQVETNAIMDTLSVFEYADSSESKTKTGVMKGMDRDTNKNRTTTFSSFQRYNTVSPSAEAKEKMLTAGMYTPVYYPVQQHKMPDAEKTYRFQIIADLPYETLTSMIKNNGFAESVTFIFSTEDKDNIESFTTISEARETYRLLAEQYEVAEGKGLESGNIAALGTISKDELADKLISLGGSSTTATSSSSNGEAEEVEVNSEESAIGVTLKRIDEALLGYEASSMNSDNVHDLFDIVRATVDLKEETFYRYFNPLKSEGGDNDLFLTRVSPALTTYFPAVLVNGYVPAGGSEVATALSPLNVSFDYFAIPSFGPCFAAHTADDSYYGVLNYELRAFYSSGFTRSLSSSANVPAVGAYEELKEALNKVQEENAHEGVIVDINLASIYVAAKRLAYINACNYIRQGQSVSYSSLSNLAEKISSHYESTGQNLIPKWREFVKDKSGALQLTGVAKDPNWTVSTAQFVQMDGDDALLPADNSDDWEGMLGQGDSDVFPLSGGPVQPDGYEDQDGIGVNRIFTAVYDEEFNKLLGEGGTYYWEDFRNIKNLMTGSNPVRPPVQGFSDNEINKYGVTFNTNLANEIVNFVTGLTGSNGNDAQKVKAALEEQLNAACEELATAVENIAKDAKLLTDAMPTTMQNCLAWADYQNASDSDNQYQQDPSEANVTINVSTPDNSKEFDATKVKNANDLKKYGLAFQSSSEAEKPQVVSAPSDDEESSIEGRIQRGVEGTTATYTNQPAIYTMSATISRVETMSSATGTAYPYSGLANGRLQSGTDKYAILQAHVIDYSSIASGIEGDLATRQRAKIVSITEPQYASLTNFLDFIGNIGALLGEMGVSMIKESSNAFSAVANTDTGTTAVTSSGAATSDAINGSSVSNAAGGISYQLSDGSVMNRMPASLGSFNPQTGEMEYNSPMTYSSGYGNVSSAFAASSAAGSMSGLAKIIIGPFSGVYAMLQVLGLMLVLVFIGFIAFKNFYAYAIASDHKMITAQTQLKTVMWRSVIAVFMIGLPPLAGGQGFEGGNFILLQVISNVISYITDIFNSTNGAAIWNIFNIDMVASFGANIALYLLYGLCCLIISLCFGFGCILLFFQALCLFVFYFLGPIVWSFYVWPYNADTDPSSKGNNTQKFSLTQKLGLSLYSGGAVGNMAPYGHITNYVIIAGLSVVWAIIFWIIGQVFIVGSGVTYTENFLSDAATYSQNSESNALGPALLVGAVLGSSWGIGSSAGPFAALRLLFTTVVCLILFIILGVMMFKALKRVTANQRGILGGTAHAIAQGAKTAVQKGGEIMEKASAVRDLAQGLGVDTNKLASGLKDVRNAKGRANKLNAMGKMLDGNAKARESIQKTMDQFKNTGKIPKNVAKQLHKAGMEVTPENAEALMSKQLASHNGLKQELKSGALGKLASGAKGAMKDPKGFMKSHGLMNDDGSLNAKELSKAAGIAQNLGNALGNANNAKDLVGNLAQLGAGMAQKDLTKAITTEKAHAKQLATAKGMIDQIASGKINNANISSKLDSSSFKALRDAGLVNGDVDDPRSWKVADGMQKGADGRKELIDKTRGKLDSDIKKSAAKQSSLAATKGNMSEGLKTLGFVSQDVAEATDGINRLHDKKQIGEIAEKMHFEDDENGTKEQKAYDYMYNPEARAKFDREYDQIATLQAIEGSEASPLTWAAAKKRIESMDSVKKLSKINDKTKPMETMQIIEDVAEECVAGIPDRLKVPSNRAEARRAITATYGVEVPTSVEMADLRDRAASGEKLDQHDLWKLGAGCAYEKLIGSSFETVERIAPAQIAQEYRNMSSVTVADVMENGIAHSQGKFSLADGVAGMVPESMRLEGSGKAMLDELQSNFTQYLVAQTGCDDTGAKVAFDHMLSEAMGKVDVSSVAGKDVYEQLLPAMLDTDKVNASIQAMNADMAARDLNTSAELLGRVGMQEAVRSVVAPTVASVAADYYEQQAQRVEKTMQYMDSAARTAISGQVGCKLLEDNLGEHDVFVKHFQDHPEMTLHDQLEYIETCTDVDEKHRKSTLAFYSRQRDTICRTAEVASQMGEAITDPEGVKEFVKGKNIVTEERMASDFERSMSSSVTDARFQASNAPAYHYAKKVDLEGKLAMSAEEIYTAEFGKLVDVCLDQGQPGLEREMANARNRIANVRAHVLTKYLPEMDKKTITQALTLMDASESDLIDIQVQDLASEASAIAVIGPQWGTASSETRKAIKSYIAMSHGKPGVAKAEQEWVRMNVANTCVATIGDTLRDEFDPCYGDIAAQEHRNSQNKSREGAQEDARKAETHDSSNTQMYENDPSYSVNGRGSQAPYAQRGKASRAQTTRGASGTGTRASAGLRGQKRSPESAASLARRKAAKAKREK